MMVPSHVKLSNREAGAVAEEAKLKKEQMYAHLDTSLIFMPIAVETLEDMVPGAPLFLKELSWHIANYKKEPCAHQYLLQRIAVAANMRT